MVRFVQNGLGIACVAKDYVLHELQSKQVYEVLLEEKVKPRKLGIAVKKGMPLSSAATQFISMLQTSKETSS